MTDGPFKNLKLGRRWTPFADAVQNEASSPTECADFASDALVQYLTTAETCAVLKDLEAYTWGQLEFAPLASVEAIFDARAKTPFLHGLQKELQFRMMNSTSLMEAIPEALSASIEEQIGEARNRFEELLISARDTHKLSRNNFEQALDKIDAAFDAADRKGIRDAVRTGNRKAFKDATSKKEGLEEGPLL